MRGAAPQHRHDAVSVGRAELSKRQDWSLEAAESLHQLVLPLLMRLVKTLRLDPNVLRDSTLQRLELLHMEAYSLPACVCDNVDCVLRRASPAHQFQKS